MRRDILCRSLLACQGMMVMPSLRFLGALFSHVICNEATFRKHVL